jgi:hypothetical protein
MPGGRSLCPEHGCSIFYYPPLRPAVPDGR